MTGAYLALLFAVMLLALVFYPHARRKADLLHRRKPPSAAPPMLFDMTLDPDYALVRSVRRTYGDLPYTGRFDYVS